MFGPESFITRNGLEGAGRALPRRQSRRMANFISSANKGTYSCSRRVRSSAWSPRTGLAASAWPHRLFPKVRCSSEPRRNCWQSVPESEFAGIQGVPSTHGLEQGDGTAEYADHAASVWIRIDDRFNSISFRVFRVVRGLNSWIVGHAFV